LCLPALPGYDIKEDTDIIEEVDLIQGGVLADPILSCDKVISF
jgi:hypothetical protein